MVGMGEAEYGKAGVNIVTLVVPSVPRGGVWPALWASEDSWKGPQRGQEGRI